VTSRAGWRKCRRVVQHHEPPPAAVKTRRAGSVKPVILITGASRGIGAATALQAARAGYTVVVNYRANRLAAEAVVQQICAMNAEAIAVQADVAVEAEILAMFATIDARLGPLHALVNSAGVVDVTCRVDQMSAARMQRIFSTNVIGSMLCAREAVLRMSTRHGGSGGAIVNLSSVAATLGSPGQYVDYAASKGAIDTFTCGTGPGSGNRGHSRQCGAPRHHRHGNSCLRRETRASTAAGRHHSDAPTWYG
jgi:NAD(P)-dependent dehydrogenase (short-subunit alcohol dehydrogenase family)